MSSHIKQYFKAYFKAANDEIKSEVVKDGKIDKIARNLIFHVST